MAGARPPSSCNAHACSIGNVAQRRRAVLCHRATAGLLMASIFGSVMELKWLEDFLSLAETGSFSRSAEQRHVTQPAFSRRIRALESWLGVALIDRSTYPTTLTPAGEAFKSSATDLV